MKKILSLILVFSLCAGILSGCGQQASEPPATTTAAVPADTASGGLSGLDAIGDMEVDEGLLLVTITLPAILFENEPDFDPDDYAQRNGFVSASVKEDGSVSVTMTKGKHTEMLSELSRSMDESFAAMVEAENTPYIKGFSHSEHFETVTVEVDRAGYEKAFDFTSLAVAISVRVYQAFLDTAFHTEVSMVDAETGEVISKTVYPDDLED